MYPSVNKELLSISRSSTRYVAAPSRTRRALTLLTLTAVWIIIAGTLSLFGNPSGITTFSNLCRAGSKIKKFAAVIAIADHLSDRRSLLVYTIIRFRQSLEMTRASHPKSMQQPD